MAPGPDGDDDDDELVDIDVELIEGPPPVPGRSPSVPSRPMAVPELVLDAEETAPGATGEPEPPAMESMEAVETRPPLAEAAETAPAAELALFEAEAAAADGGRRAALLVEVTRLREAAGALAEAALDTARAAFVTDPMMTPSLWTLRGMLAPAERWEELAAATQEAARARPAAVDPNGRADLLVELGRILEDRLSRETEAIACYEEALTLAADHPSALLSLLLAGGRRQDDALLARALAGLARRADGPDRRGGLVIEAARAMRRTPAAGGAPAALAAIEEDLRRGDPGSPIGTLLVELDSFCRGEVPAEVAALALEDLGRRVATADPALAVAIARERARWLATDLGAPEAALTALDEAARLDPLHPLVAAERYALATALGRARDADAIARAFVDGAADDDAAVDLALLHAETTIRAGRLDAATELLATSRVKSRRSSRIDLRAIELPIACRNGDAAALADSFAGESGPEALVAAGAVRAWVLGEADLAADLFRRAIVEGAGERGRAALQAEVALSLANGRLDEAASMLEKAVEPLGAGAHSGSLGDRAFETGARELLVAIYADELNLPGRALPHQRRLVALAPEAIERRVRLMDLGLQCSGAERPGLGEEGEGWLALADGAGEPAAGALRIEAGRTLVLAGDPTARSRGLTLLRASGSVDDGGLGAAALEREAETPAARARVVAAELASSPPEAPTEVVRALRFRLAHHHAADGRYAEALAALTPLRSDGDPVARAWSYELGRRSGEAILEVAVLSEEIRAPEGALGDEAGVWLAHAEALERAGDPPGAAESFRHVLALDPTGEAAADAALGLYRVASADRRVGPEALPEALDGMAAASAGDPSLAAAIRREAALARAATGALGALDLPPEAAPDAPVQARAETALLRFIAGARGADAGVVAEALFWMAGLSEVEDARSPEAVALLGRAAARARLGGVAVAERMAAAVWQAARAPALAAALADLPVAGGEPWPEGRPDPRRARARRTGGLTGIALDLEVALDAERRGALGAALAAYASVVAVDPNRLEAWTGIRRVARAGGDVLGEARALARLGALVLDPDRATALLTEAADAYERAGRVDDAIAALSRAVEIRPDDHLAYHRVHELLVADLSAPGRAEMLDGLLSYRLAAGALTPAERSGLLFERAEHRLTVLGARAEGFDDLKKILKIDPEHRASLYKLAYGALAEEDPRQAAQWLEGYIRVAGGDDPERTAEARLDLAASQEAKGEPARAVETLRQAAALRPADPKPLERMSEVYLRQGDAHGAVTALRAAGARLPDPRSKAALEMRVGEVLRDLGRDPAGAAGAFRRAADLDPLGGGTAALIALHDAVRDTRGVLEVIDREIADLRRALMVDPLDPRRLGRLAEYLAAARARGSAGATAAAISDAEAAVESVRRLVENRGAATAGPPRALAPSAGRAFVAELADPVAGGFVAEVWPHLAEVASALFPAPAPRRRAFVGPGAEPRLAWIEATAAALGLPRLRLAFSPEAGEPAALAVEDPEPALILGPGALATPAASFEVGRALGLLALRATILDRVTPDDLGPLFSSAAILAGASPPPGLPEPTEAFVKQVTRTIRGRDRKALALQSSRFGFESFDLAAWRHAVLGAADRFGLLLAGDPAAAAVARAGGSAAAIAGEPAALDLLRFALGDRYSMVKRAAEAGR